MTDVRLTFPESYVDVLPEVRDFLSRDLKLHIGGKWHAPARGAYFETIDPSSGRILARVPSGSDTRMDCDASMAKMILIGRTTSSTLGVQNSPTKETARSLGATADERSSYK